MLIIDGRQLTAITKSECLIITTRILSYDILPMAQDSAPLPEVSKAKGLAQCRGADWSLSLVVENLRTGMGSSSIVDGVRPSCWG
jgi:hypothetical protein